VGVAEAEFCVTDFGVVESPEWLVEPRAEIGCWQLLDLDKRKQQTCQCEAEENY
jgi:hypothetical protein